MSEGISILYLNGSFIPENRATISTEDRGFQFADGVYEVIRSYGGRLFRAPEHFGRLRRNLEEIRLPVEGIEELGRICERLLEENALSHSKTRIVHE